MDMMLYLAAAILILAAQWKVQNAYRTYREVDTENGWTGAQAARKILDDNGLSHVQIRETAGMLSDHYNPRNQTVNLSRDIYHGHTVAAVSVAAHECGHAIQHAQSYAGITVRDAILPAAQICSSLGWTVLIIGLLMYNSTGIVFYIGIGMLVVVALFQVVTLPVEFDASRRALAIIRNEGFVVEEEYPLAKDMLTAAALTYVAAVASSILQIIRMLLISNSRRR